MSFVSEEIRKGIKNKCVQKKEVKVLRSDAGYYIGTFDEDGPYCRLSERYYKTPEEAKKELDDRTFIERQAPEIMYCNGTCRKCLI